MKDNSLLKSVLAIEDHDTESLPHLVLVGSLLCVCVGCRDAGGPLDGCVVHGQLGGQLGLLKQLYLHICPQNTHIHYQQAGILVYLIMIFSLCCVNKKIYVINLNIQF